MKPLQVMGERTDPDVRPCPGAYCREISYHVSISIFIRNVSNGEKEHQYNSTRTLPVLKLVHAQPILLVAAQSFRCEVESKISSPIHIALRLDVLSEVSGL